MDDQQSFVFISSSSIRVFHKRWMDDDVHYLKTFKYSDSFCCNTVQLRGVVDYFIDETQSVEKFRISSRQTLSLFEYVHTKCSKINTPIIRNADERMLVNVTT